MASEYKASIFKRIPVENYEVQIGIVKLQIKVLVGIFVLMIVMFGVNRYTYSLKHIETEYYRSNLSNAEVKRITPAEQVIGGENEIIETFLMKYVRLRETKLMEMSRAKNDFVKALSSYEIATIYQREEMNYYRTYNGAIKKVKIDENIKKLDDGLYQVKFITEEIKNLAKPTIERELFVATIRIKHFGSLSENDHRREIAEFERLNPLKIEVIIYTKANYHYENENKS